ncbi:MAG: acetyl-CoA C-acyltransferase [Cyanobacteria bacterium NC_groundwater_1444_Ag_S-0.65um_54_12]|nr:acetyl-CoA C-acyltransferase [Cyanobacteria bacterium NC_groundwater_1444_Ag_S-0.65um_54_12]
MSTGQNNGRTVIVSAVRTPFGKLGGALASFSAVELGAKVIKEALTRINLAPDLVDNVIMGQVLQAGVGQIPARQAALQAGLPVTVNSLTVNKVCASGMRAITLAEQFQRLGDGTVFVAGGMESMSNVPYYLTRARQGYRMGHGELLDGMIHDGLWCAFHDVHMGQHGSTVAKEYGISREEQDAWAARSHQLAHAAWEAGKFAEEILPITIPQGKKAPLTFTRDESIRSDTTSEALAKLKPVFATDGTVTAGNAPGVNDGACALVLTSERKAEELGLQPLAAIVGYGFVATDPPYLHVVPALAIQNALARAKLALEQVDLLEINEAFASVTLTSTRILAAERSLVGAAVGYAKVADGKVRVDRVSETGLAAIRERVNVNGGAVAMGHPIGASGARIVATLAHELVRTGKRYGVAGICSGSAQGDAVIVENMRR